MWDMDWGRYYRFPSDDLMMSTDQNIPNSQLATGLQTTTESAKGNSETWNVLSRNRLQLEGVEPRDATPIIDFKTSSAPRAQIRYSTLTRLILPLKYYSSTKLLPVRLVSFKYSPVAH